MELLSKASENKFVLVLLQSKNYMADLYKIIRLVKKNGTKICYVCFSKPYMDVIEDLKNEKVDCDNFVFIDTLSSSHYDLKPVKNCVFVHGSGNLKEIREAVKRAVNKHKCEAIIFDTISTLLIYQQTHSIVRFTHELLTDKSQKETNKVYIVLKEAGIYKGESTKLINDLNLFADKTIEITD
jgi:KaiC/GvpD/RAD55 family RecA-like ATPase